MNRLILILCLLLVLPGATYSEDRTAVSASLADVKAVVDAANDGDRVYIPEGTPTWSSALAVNKNIQIFGAGEGKTNLTPSVPQALIISVNLTKEFSGPDTYSFRLSGMTINNAIVTLNSNTTSSDAYVLGMVSRVRIDHITMANPTRGHSFSIRNILGVMDHCSFVNAEAPIVEIGMARWTPDTYSANGTIAQGTANTETVNGITRYNFRTITPQFIAQNGFGSWADKNYYGENKFFFIEDCYFKIRANGGNATDVLEGARNVFRHNTVDGGTVADHGFEGRSEAGIRAWEIYNNYFVNAGYGFNGQFRSGTVLNFNNHVPPGMAVGQDLSIKRYDRNEPNWGTVSGNNRYDDNVGGTNNSGAILVKGTVDTASVNTAGVPDSNWLTLKNITIGSLSDIVYDSNAWGYGIVNTSNYYKDRATVPPPGPDTTWDVGWKFNSGDVTKVVGGVLTTQNESGNSLEYGGQWAPGDIVEIRKYKFIYGQMGQGMGNLLRNQAGKNTSYYTYNYPNNSATSPKAQYPGRDPAGNYYPLEPIYTWNMNRSNTTDPADASKVLAFSGGASKPSVKENRDYYNLGERLPLAAQQVGWGGPEGVITYNRATTNYPQIGPNQTITYAPYTYPHPLTTGATPTPTPSPSGTPTPNKLPTISITAPAAGPQGVAPKTIMITTNPQDADGQITRVEFYDGATQLLPAATASPWSYTWTNIQAGLHSLTAKAFDNTTGSAVSDPPIVISLATPTPTPGGKPTPPTIKMTSP